MTSARFDPAKARLSVLKAQCERRRRDWMVSGLFHQNEAAGRELLRFAAMRPSRLHALARRVGIGSKG